MDCIVLISQWLDPVEGTYGQGSTFFLTIPQSIKDARSIRENPNVQNLQEIKCLLDKKKYWE